MVRPIMSYPEVHILSTHLDRVYARWCAAGNRFRNIEQKNGRCGQENGITSKFAARHPVQPPRPGELYDNSTFLAQPLLPSGWPSELNANPEIRSDRRIPLRAVRRLKLPLQSRRCLRDPHSVSSRGNSALNHRLVSSYHFLLDKVEQVRDD